MPAATAAASASGPSTRGSGSTTASTGMVWTGPESSRMPCHVRILPQRGALGRWHLPQLLRRSADCFLPAMSQMQVRATRARDAPRDGGNRKRQH